MASLRVTRVSNFSLFTFAPVQTLVLGVPKSVKEGVVKYLSSDRHDTGGVRKGAKTLVVIRAQLL